jgi:hypothetical protein
MGLRVRAIYHGPMSPSRSRAADFILAAGVTAGAWTVLYQVNARWLTALEWADGVSWIFLPAAVRLLAVLLFGSAGALGLFVGGLFTMSMIEEAPLPKALGIAGVSALAPLLAVGLTLRRLRLPASLSGLGTRHLVLLALASAAASVLLHNLYYWFSDQRGDPLSGLLPMFAGDIAGTVIVLYVVRSALRLHLRVGRAYRIGR